mgnify:FL=1|jgi:hypothetical protein
MHTNMKLDNLQLIALTALVTMTLISALYTVLHKPELPHHAVVVQDGLVDVWTQDQMLMKDGVLYITFDPIRQMNLLQD